jgi:hypothetical protein
MSSKHENRKGADVGAISRRRCMDHLPFSGADPFGLIDPAVDLCCLAAQIRVSHENWSRREFEIIARALDRAASRIWELEREQSKQGDLLAGVDAREAHNDCG